MGYVERDGTYQSRLNIQGSQPWTMLTWNCHGSSVNALSYMSVNEVDQRTGTESTRQIKITKKGVLKRLSANVSANTKSGSTTVSLRINGVSKNVITIGAGVIGQLQTVQDVPIDANDLICFEIDTSGSVIGSISITPLMAELSFTW